MFNRDSIAAAVLDRTGAVVEASEAFRTMRGERLVESNPKLVPLLMEMGEEQMRIAKDPELSAALSILLEE